MPLDSLVIVGPITYSPINRKTSEKMIKARERHCVKAEDYSNDHCCSIDFCENLNLEGMKLFNLIDETEPGAEQCPKHAGTVTNLRNTNARTYKFSQFLINHEASSFLKEGNQFQLDTEIALLRSTLNVLQTQMEDIHTTLQYMPRLNDTIAEIRSCLTAAKSLELKSSEVITPVQLAALAQDILNIIQKFVHDEETIISIAQELSLVITNRT